MRPTTIAIIIIGVLAGAFLALLSLQWPAGSTINVLLLTLGSALVATAFISMALDLFWSRERARMEAKELQPIYEQFTSFTNQLGKLEGRMEAFKQLGFNYCHSSRKHALESFLSYAKDVILGLKPEVLSRESAAPSVRTVNIVSSSARGLMGYLDREPREEQRQWRNLITEHPHHFRILLTHPAYAHLRQPAEERSSGDIELEILKTSIYLQLVAGMTSRELRFYRGSPTVFTIQAGQHILLNPYPYGRMAMDTLCLEFESQKEDSLVGDFVSMHFNHTWAFTEQDSKRVDGKPLVTGVETFGDILDAFAECVFVEFPDRLRLTRAQVIELDGFTKRIVRGAETRAQEIASADPFSEHVRKLGVKVRDEGIVALRSGLLSDGEPPTPEVFVRS